jgi:oxygen-independent coproporphyrinogen-3 oxidase
VLAAARHNSSGSAGFGARSLYIHVPFCFHKCHYCDFYSIVDTRDRQDAFTDRLIRELRALAPHASRPLETIFVGGGTPSLLRLDLWERVLTALREEFDLSLMFGAKPASERGLAREPDLGQVGDPPGEPLAAPAAGEFTVECNPETVTPELMNVLRAGGVSRVSIGAQSFDASHLKTLERWHDPANVARAIDLARSAGIARQSLDLIYAIPGQTLEQLGADLDRALALNTEHISAYTLTYEPNTAMTARLRKGEFTRADEDLEADMFEHVLARLRAAGLDRYEVSNFAQPGAECRHNLAYWRQHDWLAAGPSASGHVAGHRWKNLPRLDDYLAREQASTGMAGFAAITDHEPPDAKRNLGELLWTALRTREGLLAADVLPAAASLPDGAAIAPRLEACIARHRAMGNLQADFARIRPTDRGLLIADRMAVDVLRALG